MKILGTSTNERLIVSVSRDELAALCLCGSYYNDVECLKADKTTYARTVKDLSPGDEVSTTWLRARSGRIDDILTNSGSLVRELRKLATSINATASKIQAAD